MACKAWLQRLFVQKTYSTDEVLESELRRALSLLDLIALATCSTLGVGLYVIAGDLARNTAGPGVVLSFVFAAFATILSGICYAEVACRVPRAGSAYAYTYVTIGESMAFIIGWNMILEYVIGTASIARAFVNYVDAFPGVDHAMEMYFIDKMPFNTPYLAAYPDFLSFFLVMIVTVWLIWGVKESTVMNNIFSAINMATIILVIVAGAVFSDLKYWSIPKEDIPDTVRDTNVGKDGGEGGFLPYGFWGVMEGTAVAFYAFIGFDAIATAGEETRNPGRDIPLAMCISLGIISCAYIGATIVLTLMLPYYMQDEKAPVPYAFRYVHQPILAWIITIGAMASLTTSMFGSMFPLPRIVYAMANDGLLFKFLARVHPKTKTPLIATLVAGVLSAIMAAIFELSHLIDMMSIGTLFAYTIVAVSVLILRYEHPDRNSPEYPGLQETTRVGRLRVLDHIFNISRRKYPTLTSSRITKYIIGIIYLLQFILSLIFVLSIEEDSYFHDGLLFALVVFLLFVIFTLLIVLTLQPTATEMLAFKVPLVPLIPFLSIMINTYLMLMLNTATWIRFAVWMVVGFFIYFIYGVSHSVVGLRLKTKRLEQLQT